MAFRLAANPVTTPPLVIDAMVALVPPLAHVPPLMALVSVICLPKHTLDGPTIGDRAFTVTVDIATQPVDRLYDIMADPDDTPVIRPPVPIVTIEELLVLHVPPAVGLVAVGFDCPTHIGIVPDMELAVSAFTVTVFIALQVELME